MKSIAILKTDSVHPQWVAEFGEYPDMFQRVFLAVNPDLMFDVYDVQLGEYPEQLDQHGAYLITGSKAGVYEDHPWLPPLIDFVRILDQAHIPLLGICFGHQLVAHALGGEVSKSEKGWGVGVHEHGWRAKPDWVTSKQDSFQVLVSHQDQVQSVASGLQVIAGSEFCPNAVLYKPEHILTFQGHPEFIEDYSRALMIHRHDRIDESAMGPALASLEKGHDGLKIVGWMLEFLRCSGSPIAGIRGTCS